jgi:4-hydroxy-tetrahydrodipicolinate synthase
MFTGSMVALVTPMNEDGSLDKQSVIDLVEWHIACKTDAIVASGTTGESATLNADEQFELTALIVKQVKGRIPVIAGTGSNATASAIKLSAQAKRAGADACLVVTPYYNRPTQNGLYEHYKAIAAHSELPIILYNVPARTACDLLPETVLRLSQLANIIGIKEASGKVERSKEIIKICDKKFEVYAGDDCNALACMQAGAKGLISVVANIVPEKVHALCAAALAGNYSQAQQINTELLELQKKLFIETNPIPSKWALSLMKKIKPNLRLPLLPLDKAYHQEVKQALQQAGVNLCAN